MTSSPIGIFDSGVGGLSVLREIKRQLPFEDLIYIADQAHVPYGPRPKSDIQQFSEAITKFLLDHEAKLIVVACNTASAAALSFLRRRFPQVSFIGMEPAVKPAALVTQTGKVGILATEGTFASQRYAALMTRFGQNITLFEDPCLGLVDLIEQGNFEQTEALLTKIVQPMLMADVDTLVLGCTHYPFVIPILQKVAGTAVSIIDPAPAVARQVKRVLDKESLLTSSNPPGTLVFITTNHISTFKQQVLHLLGYNHEVEAAVWHEHNGDLALQFSQVDL